MERITSILPTIRALLVLVAMCLAGGSAWYEGGSTAGVADSGPSKEMEVRNDSVLDSIQRSDDGVSDSVAVLSADLLTSYLPIVFASGAPIDTLPPESSESPSEVQPELQLRDLYCLTDVDGVTNCEDVSLLPPQSDTYFWYGVEHIGWCESKYRVWVISRTQDYGLMQIHFPTHTARINRLGYGWENMLEFGPNLWAAYDLYLEQGQSFRAWSCARIVGME